MAHYPITGPASIIACPRHNLSVALNEDGRIAASCPHCDRVAAAGEAWIVANAAARQTEAETWSTCA